MFDIFSVWQALRKNLTANNILFFAILAGLFLLTRLINLDKFPIFNDEAIYIHWAKTAWHDGSMRFISLTDGKQPLQTWGTIPFLKLFADNMLLGARLYAVMNGLISLLGMGVLANYLFGKKAAFWGMFFYIFTPYFLFYDRLALVDSGVNAAVIWMLFFSIWLVNKRQLNIAFVFGVITGIGLLAKSSVRIFLGLAVFAPILIYNRSKSFLTNAVNYFVLLGITCVISLVIYNVQRLSPFMHFITEKNATFVMTFSDFFHTPFQYFFRNIILIPQYVFQESAFILPLLGCIGLGLLLKKNRKVGIYLLIWIAVPFIIVSFLSIVLYPRYILFFPSLLSLCAAYLISIQKNKRSVILLCVIFIISVVYFDYTILFSPENIPLVAIDRSQYLEDWPAGWGIKEIIAYSEKKSIEKPVILLAEGNFGMASDSLESLRTRVDETRISVWGRWPLTDKDVEDARKELKNKYVFIVLSQKTDIPASWNTKLIEKYTKPGNKSTVYFLELLPQ